MAEKYTQIQGQYLAFIYNYTVMFGKAPSENDLRAFFGTAPPTVHRMILKLEELGFISRIPGQSRSINLLVDPDYTPRLRKPDKK
jgi:repressor LexA